MVMEAFKGVDLYWGLFGAVRGCWGLGEACNSPGKAAGSVYAVRGGAAEAGRSTEAALASVLLRHSASSRLSSSHSSGAVSERCRRLRRALGGPAPSILTTHAWPAPSEGRHAEGGVVGSSGTAVNTVRASSC